MLRITVHDDETKRRIEAAGKMAGPWVAELESAWRRAPESAKPTELDMRDVTCVDRGGRLLLEQMHRAGVRLIACGVAMTALVDEIAK